MDSAYKVSTFKRNEMEAEMLTPTVEGPGGPGQTLGVFLEEVAYFLEDMQHDLWWLLQAAHQPSGQKFFRGDEELQEVSPEVQEIINRLRERASTHQENHGNQVRAKIALIPACTAAEEAVLRSLSQLKFNCKGRIETFHCMKEANNAQIWAAYHNTVGTHQPQWTLRTDGLGQKKLFAQCVVVVPVMVDKAKQDVKLFNVWCPEKKKRHWAFPGGDIVRGTDRNLYDSARREFHEEVGVFFGRNWSQCFTTALPEDDSELSGGACMFVSFEKDGVRYPCRPHIFVQVTEDFYEVTRAYEDNTGIIKMPQPEGDYVRWDDLASARRVHLEGTRFVEHDEARWLQLEFETGKVLADDNRGSLRKENADLLKSRPRKVWHWLASLLGVDPPTRPSNIPADFPMDGPFAVRMSGIDKTATDKDITEFFEELTVKAVRQFDYPKHTARIEFFDMNSLELALSLSGRNLLRRKVKVELWVETEENAEAPPGAPLQEYTGVLPDEPPFQCRCRGLDRSVTRDDIGYFFWDRNCQVRDVMYPLKSERHAGMIEFDNQESLRRALSLQGAIFKGRELNLEIAGKNDDKRVDPTPERRGGDRDRDRPGKGGGRGAGGRGLAAGGGGGRGYSNREPPSREEFGSERPKLQLKPRSVTADDEHHSEGVGDRTSEPMLARQPSSGSGGKSDPFGGARPRDERFKPTRADHDDNWRR